MSPASDSKIRVRLGETGRNVPVVKLTSTADDRPWVPPDEAMWANFAGNGEPWLSWLGSAALHGLCLLVILTGALWIFTGDSSIRVSDIGIVRVDDEGPGGGGGDPAGEVPNAPGNQTRPDNLKPLDANNKEPLTNLPVVDTSVKPNTAPTIDKDPIDFIARLPKNAPKTLGPILEKALQGLNSQGNDPRGSDGGDGGGSRGGHGDKIGPGGNGTFRGERVKRWELEFRFSSPAGFLQQLDALGCFVGFPDKAGKLMFIRNLKERPARPAYEDLRKMNRVYFIDQRTDVNDGIAEELKLDLIPSAIIAAMPIAMEEQLVAIETKFLGRKEEDILRTRFLVTFIGGKANFKVVEQDPKRARK